MTASARIAKVALAAVLCLALSGCTQWQVSRGPVPAAAFDAVTRGQNVRVELNSGAVTVVKGATVTSDSLIGARADRGGFAARIAFALTDIRRVEYAFVSAGPTVWYIVSEAVILFFGLALFLFAALGDG